MPRRCSESDSSWLGMGQIVAIEIPDALRLESEAGEPGDQRSRAKLRPPGPLDGVLQRQVEDVALRVAAAETVGERGQAGEKPDRERVVAATDRQQRPARRQAELPRGL